MSVQANVTQRDKHLLQGMIPNFCGLVEVFILMISAQLLAFVFALMANTEWNTFWLDLGLISFQIQWMALLGAALLCLARKGLNRQSDTKAALLSYVLLMLVVMLVSESAYQIHFFLYNFNIDHGSFLLRNFALAAVIIAVFLRYLYVIYQWRKNVEAQAQARVKMLQARIRPHFLFNCMNTIASLTRTDPEIAEKVVEDLAELFRYSLSEDKKRVLLSHEMGIIQRYLDIESIRLDTRLKVNLRVNVPEDALIPPLTLQPLVENAIYHGIEPRAQGGCLDMDLQLIDNKLSITIQNPLPATPVPSKGHGIAVANIKERLQLWYGTAANFNIERNGSQFIVQLELPYETANPKNSINSR